MSFFDVFIYSFVQSFCEFFPISSSGHLAVLHKYLSIKDPGVEFDLFLHLASLMAICLYFREKIKKIFRDLYVLLKTRDLKDTSLHLTLSLISSTFFSVIFILAFKGLSKIWGRFPLVISLNLIFFGVLLYIVDKNSRSSRSFSSGRLKDFFFLGFSQALAIFPGVSRSGITITSMRYMGFSRKDSAEFSFLMAIPIILMGCAYKFYPFITNKSLPVFNGLTSENYALAFVLTFLMSSLFIHLFLKFVNRISFSWFMIYRVILGVLIISELIS